MTQLNRSKQARATCMPEFCGLYPEYVGGELLLTWAALKPTGIVFIFWALHTSTDVRRIQTFTLADPLARSGLP